MAKYSRFTIDYLPGDLVNVKYGAFEVFGELKSISAFVYVEDKFCVSAVVVEQTFAEDFDPEYDDELKGLFAIPYHLITEISEWDGEDDLDLEEVS